MAISLFSYLLTTAICFLGLFAGSIVSYMAREELKSGAKYFLWLKRILVTVVVGSLMYSHREEIFYVIGLITVLAAFQIFIKRDFLIYPFLGITLSQSSSSEQAFIINSVCIFFYGLPTAGILIERERRKGWSYTIGRLLALGILFVAGSCLFYLV